MPEGQTECSKQRLREDALPGIVHGKATHSIVDKFRDADVS